MKVINGLFLGLILANYALAETESSETKEEKDDLCQKQMESIQDCFVLTKEEDVDDLKERCVNFNSKKCKNFYSDPFAVADECLKSMDQSSLQQKWLRQMKMQELYGKLACETTDEGKRCPILQSILDNSDPEDVEDVILDNCKYSGCNEAYLKVMQHSYEENESEHEKFAIDVINSDKCKAKRKEATTTTTEKTTTTTTTEKQTKEPTPVEEDYDALCQEQLESINDCFVINEEKDAKKLEERCVKFDSKKCKNFYSDPFAVADKCKKAMKSESLQQKWLSQMEMQELYGKLACETTDEGKRCPILQTILDNSDPEDVEDTILENCQYSNCNEAYLKVMEYNHKYNSSEHEEFALKLIKSDKCKAKAVVSSTTTEESTTTAVEEPTTTTTNEEPTSIEEEPTSVEKEQTSVANEEEQTSVNNEEPTSIEEESTIADEEDEEDKESTIADEEDEEDEEQDFADEEPTNDVEEESISTDEEPTAKFYKEEPGNVEDSTIETSNDEEPGNIEEPNEESSNEEEPTDAEDLTGESSNEEEPTDAEDLVGEEDSGDEELDGEKSNEEGKPSKSKIDSENEESEDEKLNDEGKPSKSKIGSDNEESDDEKLNDEGKPSKSKIGSDNEESEDEKLNDEGKPSKSKIGSDNEEVNGEKSNDEGKSSKSKVSFIKPTSQENVLLERLRTKQYNLNL